jgi:hypothetical protein
MSDASATCLMRSAAGRDIDVVAVANPFLTAPAAAGEKYSQVSV